MTKPVVHACIFDCDGLLLNTEEIYFQIGRTIIGRYGKTFEWSLKSRLMGMPWNEACELLIETLELPVSPDEYFQQAKELHHLFMEAEVLPGVERLLKNLKAHRVPFAVASSSLTSSFKLKTTRHGPLFSLFDTVVLGDDPAVLRGKPHPDIFLTAASRLAHLLPLTEMDPSRILAFEDSPTGVTAARRAGMPVIWIPDARMDPNLFHSDPMVFKLNSMAEFIPEEFGLPSLSNLN